MFFFYFGDCFLRDLNVLMCFLNTGEPLHVNERHRILVFTFLLLFVLSLIVICRHRPTWLSSLSLSRSVQRP